MNAFKIHDKRLSEMQLEHDEMKASAARARRKSHDKKYFNFLSEVQREKKLKK